MARRIEKGVGMKERVVIQHDASNFPDKQSFANAFSRSLDALEVSCIPRNVRAENERRCRAILESAVLKQGDIESARRLMEYSEDSAVRLADEWLRTFRRVERLKTKVEGGQTSAVTDLIDEAERLGVIQERFWWRCGLDYSTGKRREILATSGRDQVKGGIDGKRAMLEFG